MKLDEIEIPPGADPDLYRRNVWEIANAIVKAAIDDYELRRWCLEKALSDSRQQADTMKLAENFYNWVRGGSPVLRVEHSSTG